MFASKSLDFYVHPRRKIELHQRIDRVRGGLENIDQALVRAHLKLLARFLVHMWRPQHRPAVDDCRQRNRPRYICAGPLRCVDNLFRRLIENAVVVCLQTNPNFFSVGHVYSLISATAPAPTVWPPSRMANRNPFSSATGVISDISTDILSPGITSSTPCGSFTSPVTSVVRK